MPMNVRYQGPGTVTLGFVAFGADGPEIRVRPKVVEDENGEEDIDLDIDIYGVSNIENDEDLKQFLMEFVDVLSMFVHEGEYE